ncbi:MAG: hypothetical protein ACOVQM_12780 [Pirellula sp.]
MNELVVLIANQKFDHMVFHAALIYSNLGYMNLCVSESFKAHAKGIQGYFHAIGGVTQRISYDSLSAAVHNLSTDRHLTANFTNLLELFHVDSHRKMSVRYERTATASRFMAISKIMWTNICDCVVRETSNKESNGLLFCVNTLLKRIEPMSRVS